MRGRRVRHLWAWPMWGFAVAMLVVAAIEIAVTAPALIALGPVLFVAVVVLADRRRVVWLALLALALGLVIPFVDPGGAPVGYWARSPWLVVLCGLAGWLAGVEERRGRGVTRSSRMLGDGVEATDQPVFVKDYRDPVDGFGRYVLANEAWSRTASVDHGTGAGSTDAMLFPPAIAEALREADQQVMSSHEAITVEEKVGSDPRNLRTFLVTKFPLYDEDDEVWGVGGIATDVTETKRAEERLVAVFARSPMPTLRLSSGGPERTRVVDANDAVERLFGVDIVGASSERLATLVHPDDVTDTWALTDSVIEAARDVQPGETLPSMSGREVRVLGPEGGYRWVVLSISAVGAPEVDGTQELIVQFDDITARKEAEAALTERALTDSVTALPNRYALSDRLSTALHRLTRRPGIVCVLFCDLDHFKQVNDVFGHQVGDRLLSEVAARLTSALRPEDTVGRQGGDEFVIVCEGLEDPTDAALLAVRLQDRLREPWWYGNHQFLPTASIGIAHTSDPRADPVDLLRKADVAMYRAKDSGRDRIETYDRSLDDELSSALEMQQRLREALRTDGMVLHYQPVVRLSDGLVVGAEALVRMRDLQGGLLAPGAFLPHAEASGLIGEVGTWVVDRALRDMRAWHDAGIQLDVGVNISPTQLNRPGLATALLGAVEDHGLDPRWVIVEVTETALINESSVALASLVELHAAGVRIALDDFGTGYSSLSWLHQFPVDIVKIDKSFVQTVLTDHRRAVIVRALLDIADETGLGVVAEGVETEQQRAFLDELGCEAAQGWLFGRAVPVEDASWAAARFAGHAAGGRRPAL